MIEVLLPNIVAKIVDGNAILQIKFYFMAGSGKPKLKANRNKSFGLLAFSFSLQKMAHRPPEVGAFTP